MPEVPATVKSGVYYIQHTTAKTVIELPGGSSTDGVRVQGFAKRGLSDASVASQLWIISQVGNDNLYTIQNARGGTFMDLEGGNKADGTPIIGYHATTYAQQRWVITRTTDCAAYVIANHASGTYVDLYYANSANGTAVQGWYGKGPASDVANGSTTRWELVRPE